MNEDERVAIVALIEIVDSLSESRRNMSMTVFADYPEINRLRKLVQSELKK